jgi:integrase
VGQTEARAFLLYLRQETKLSARTYSNYLAALCFLYRQTLARPEVVEGIPFPRVPRAQVAVPTVDEVRAILNCAPTPFVRTMFETTYGCGLRASEVCALQAGDIDSAHGLIHVRHGKGDKPRSVMLGDRLLTALRRHWRIYNLRGPWLFPRRAPRDQRTSGSIWADAPVYRTWLSGHFLWARRAAGLKRRITLHGLRHAFATHLLEHGVDIAVLRVLMGHTDIATTAHYASVRTDLLRTTPSPLDLLYDK